MSASGPAVDVGVGLVVVCAQRVRVGAADQGVGAGSAGQLVVAVVPGYRVRATTTVCDVATRVPRQGVGPEPAVELVVARAAGERVARVAGMEHHLAGVRRAGAQAATPVDGVRSGEAEDLDPGGEGREGDVGVAVGVERHARSADEMESGPVVPLTITRSLASPSRVAISISDVPVSAVAPGANAPPDWSITRVSTDPATPPTVIVSVFAVVAAPHAAGGSPNQISLPATSRVACPPAVIVALTALVTAL